MSRAEYVKHAHINRVESDAVYGDGRYVSWHRFQYLIWRSFSKAGSDRVMAAISTAKKSATR